MILRNLRIINFLNLIKIFSIVWNKNQQISTTMINVYSQGPQLIRVHADPYPPIFSLVKRKGKNWKRLIQNGIPAKLWNKSVFYGRKWQMMKNKNSKFYLKKIEQGMKMKEKSLLIKKRRKRMKMKLIKSSILLEGELK